MISQRFGCYFAQPVRSIRVMRFHRFAILALIVVAACMFALSAADQQQPTTQPKHPFWSLAPAEKRKLLVGASTLKAGDTYNQVIAALGKPKDDRQLIPKGSNVSHGRSL